MDGVDSNAIAEGPRREILDVLVAGSGRSGSSSAHCGWRNRPR